MLLAHDIVKRVSEVESFDLVLHKLRKVGLLSKSPVPHNTLVGGVQFLGCIECVDVTLALWLIDANAHGEVNRAQVEEPRKHELDHSFLR